MHWCPAQRVAGIAAASAARPLHGSHTREDLRNPLPPAQTPAWGARPSGSAQSEQRLEGRWAGTECGSAPALAVFKQVRHIVIKVRRGGSR